jgi:hypothetical protein
MAPEIRLTKYKKTRYLKVVRSFSARPRPHLPLTGLWLEQAGFSAGMRVQVIVKQGSLVIRPDTPDKEK